MALDKKGRIELVVTASFILAFLLILYSSLSGSKKGPALSVTPQAHSQAAGAKQDTVKKLKNLEWGRDPFMFGTAKVYSDENGVLVLNGIAWDENAPSAIINNKIVKVGDEVAGNKITGIKKDRVIVTKDGSSYELNLRQKVGQ